MGFRCYGQCCCLFLLQFLFRIQPPELVTLPGKDWQRVCCFKHQIHFLSFFWPFTGVGFRLHENGELKLECTFKDGLKHGKYEQFYENGKVKLETYFEEDKQDGLTKEYHENGVLYIESNWKEGKLDELIKEYNENGEF